MTSEVANGIGGSSMAVPDTRRIVVGVDGSAESVSALGWACHEAALRTAEVHAVYVWETPCHAMASYASASRSTSARPPGDGAGAARSVLWRAVGSVDTGEVRVRAEVAEGLAARVLLDRACGADMLVLGAGARSDTLHSAGPVLRACVRRAPCPVVVIGPDDSAGQPLRGDVPVSAGAWS